MVGGLSSREFLKDIIDKTLEIIQDNHLNHNFQKFL
jgi:hypothetical protein